MNETLKNIIRTALLTRIDNIDLIQNSSYGRYESQYFHNRYAVHIERHHLTNIADLMLQDIEPMEWGGSCLSINVGYYGAYIPEIVDNGIIEDIDVLAVNGHILFETIEPSEGSTDGVSSWLSKDINAVNAATYSDDRPGWLLIIDPDEELIKFAEDLDTQLSNMETSEEAILYLTMMK